VPWSFRVWLGKGHPSPVQLTCKLLATVPKSLVRNRVVLVQADTEFGTVKFLHAVRQRSWRPIVGLRGNRKLQDGAVSKACSVTPSEIYKFTWRASIIPSQFPGVGSNGLKANANCVLWFPPILTLGRISSGWRISVGRSKASLKSPSTSLACMALVKAPS